MNYKQAKKIVSDNGIQWSNYFDLDFVSKNMNQEENSKIFNAIKFIKDYLIVGECQYKNRL